MTSPDCARPTYDGAAANNLVKDVTQVSAASKLRDHEIIDARAPDRFRGEAPEPREGLRSGHGLEECLFKTLLNADNDEVSP